MRSVLFDNEIAYECLNYPNYFITESGILVSTYIKGARGRVDLSNPRKLSYGKDSDGYYRVVLCTNGKHNYVKVHTVMAEQFLGGVPDGMCVNHKDGNKTNNDISNLEVITFGENTRHAWKFGLSSVENMGFNIPVNVEHDGSVTYCESLEECCRLFKDITISYLNHLRNGIVSTHDLRFIHVGDSRNYTIEVYRNSKLFNSFNSVKDAALYFGLKNNTISSLCYRKTSGWVFNEYFITFPNVSTIEST